MSYLGRVEKLAVMNYLYHKLMVTLGEGWMPEIEEVVKGVEEIPPSNAYSECVKAIMDSDMSSYYKTSAMNSLPVKEDPALYEALVHIFKSDNMSDYYKVDSAKKIIKKYRS